MNPSGDKRESSDVGAAGSDQPQQKKSKNVSDFENYLAGLDKEGTWKRPDLPALDSKLDSLIFQQVEVDHYIEKSEDDKGPVPIIRMFGVTVEGNSVCCHVLGFRPYIFIKTPQSLTKDNLEKFKNAMNKALLDDLNNNTFGVVEAVVTCEFVEKIVGNQASSSFVKITLAIPELAAAAEKLLRRGQVNMAELEEVGSIQALEANVDFVVRLMADRNLGGCSWVELPPGTWERRDGERLDSRCQLEVEVAWQSFIPHQAEGTKVAPLRILSLDIECDGRPGKFPVPELDPVILISSLVVRYGEQQPFIRTVFTLKSCEPIPGTSVVSCDQENDLLAQWAAFFRDCDPDIITGYNVNHFDLAYLIRRAKKLNVPNFSFLSRITNIPSEVKKVFAGSQYILVDLDKKKVNTSINMEGRVTFDMVLILMQDLNLKFPGKLESFSQKYLKEGKEEVDYKEISSLQAGDSHTRRRIALYCLKDAHLPLALSNKLGSIEKHLELARTGGVPLSFTSYLKNGGTQIKAVSEKLR